MKIDLRRGLAACLMLMLATPGLAVTNLGTQKAPAEAKTAKQPDPLPDLAVRFGTLPNGLRYAIFPNRSPAGAISIRLAMDVGSYVEAEDERGYAHFVEHMAFRSTRLAPNGALDNRFARLGVQLGRDQNAFTRLLSTTYGIDLPGGGIDGARDVLQWMRSAASDILFTPEAVSAERGVVLAELQTRNGPLVAAQREVARFQAPGLRSVDRDPGGTEASLAGASPASLQRFYDRWYRPENAVLVVAGDADADALEALVRGTFSDWKGRGAPGTRPPPPGKMAERGIDVLSLANSAMPSALSACRLASRTPDGAEPERLRRDILSQLWQTIFSQRLQHLANTPGSPFLAALMVVGRDAPDAQGSCLVVMPTAGRWKEALASAQAELRRFAKDGPTAAELAGAIDRLEGPLRGAVVQKNSRMSATVSDQIVSAMLLRRPFQAPDTALTTLEGVAVHARAEEVKAAFERDWSGAGPLLSAIAPDPPTKEELLAAWNANESAAPLSAYADRETAVWPYRFGRPGKVAKREIFTNPDFVRIGFRNGVVLNFRHSDLQAGDVEIRVRLGRGASAIPPEQRAPAALGAGLFPSGGLGKLDFEQIGAIFANTSWRFELSIQTTAFLLTSSPLADQTEDQLNLLAAYVTDPAFRPSMDEKMPTAIDFAYRYLATDPGRVAMDAVEQKLFPGQGSLPPREQMNAWHADDFERLLKPTLTGAPIEVTIVGDISEERAVAAVAESFGALPRRKKAPDQPSYPFRRFPETLPASIDAVHQGPTDKAAAILIWPLYVATPERRKEEYALSLTAAIFQSRLLQQARVEMGKTYSPAAITQMPDDADQGFLAAGIEASPADLDNLIAVARKIAAELAAGSISQDELDKARQPMIAARLQAQKRNAPWAAVLTQAAAEPAAVDELVAYPQQIGAITLEDVKAAAATWLRREPLVARALPAAAGSPAQPR